MPLTRNSIQNEMLNMVGTLQGGKHTFSLIGQIPIAAAILNLNRACIKYRERLGLFGFDMRVTLHGGSCYRECREHCPSMHFASCTRILLLHSETKQKGLCIYLSTEAEQIIDGDHCLSSKI